MEEARRRAKRQTLQQIPLLAGTSAETLEQLMPLVEYMEVDTVGRELIRCGELPSHLFFLVRGSVSVVLQTGLRVAKVYGHGKKAVGSFPFFGPNPPALTFFPNPPDQDT